MSCDGLKSIKKKIFPFTTLSNINVMHSDSYNNSRNKRLCYRKTQLWFDSEFISTKLILLFERSFKSRNI